MFHNELSPNLRPYIFNQLNRYGAMTGVQLYQVCSHLTGKSNLYRILQMLRRDGCIHRMAHPIRPISAFCLAPHWQANAGFDEDGPKPFRVRSLDLEHALMCTEVLTRLTYFPNISGVATEYELTPSEAQAFCKDRVPDGIGQITRESNVSYEFAIEVETSRKSFERIKKIIDNYVDTVLSNSYQCEGVIFVAPRPGIYAAYKAAIQKIPDGAKKRLIVISKPDLSELNQEIYGEPGKHAYASAERVRNLDSGQIEYLPMFSTHPLPRRSPDRDIPMPSVTPDSEHPDAEGVIP